MDVLMPQLGETVAEGKITKWFKSAGEPVKPGDNLFEIETDKVSMEVPSTTTGVLAEIRVAAGEVAPVGAVVGVISDGSGAAASSPAAAAPAKSAEVSPPLIAAKAAIQRSEPMGPRIGGDERPSLPLDPFFEVRTPERNFGPARLPGGMTVTPLARRLAGEAGIELSRVRGSGPHGRIVARDIAVHRHHLWRPLHGNRSPISASPSCRRDQGALRAGQSTRKCRSTACAAPSRRG